MKSSIMILFYRILFCLLLLVLLPSCNNDKSGLQNGDPTDFKDAVLINQYGITSITIDAKNPIIQTGKTQQYTATGKTSTGGTVDISQDVHWTVSNTAASKIDDSGLLTGLAQGDVIVTASLSTYTNSANLRVTDATVENIIITSDYTSDFTTAIPACEPLQLKAKANYTGETEAADVTDEAVWKTAATQDVAHFSTAPGENGLLLTSAVVDTGFEVSATADSITKTVSVITKDGFTSSGITLDPSSYTLPATNATQAFTAKASFDDGNSNVDITEAANWSSDNTAIASVSNAVGSKGLVSAHAVGIAYIKARCGLDTIFKTAQVNVNNKTLISVTIDYVSGSTRGTDANGEIVTLYINDTLKLSASALYSDNSSPTTVTADTWESTPISGDSNAISISNDGTVSANALGSALITATYNGKSDTLNITVTTAP